MNTKSVVAAVAVAAALTAAGCGSATTGTTTTKTVAAKGAKVATPVKAPVKAAGLYTDMTVLGLEVQTT